MTAVALGAGAVLVALVAGGLTPLALAGTSAGDRAIYEPLAPARILDTRTANVPLKAGESRVLQVSGAGGVPGDAVAVVLNVTAVGPTAGTYLTVYPEDVTRPTASSLNAAKGQTVANAVTVKLSSLGKVRIFNVAGLTHVVVDVAGFYRAHDHDDRYLTKGQAQARTAASSLTCSAGSFLNAVAPDGTPTCGVGATGPQGPAGVSGYETVTGVQSAVLQGDFLSVAADCPSGKRPISGGFLTDVQGNARVIQSKAGTTGWMVTVRAIGGDGTIVPYAVCANAS